jgi:microcin C transport system permease protein
MDTAVAPAVPARRSRLSPLNQRRIANFKRNRRGYWSLWIFAALFVVTLCAELIANDRPIVVRYDGHFYFPVFFEYPRRPSAASSRPRRPTRTPRSSG